MIRIRKYCAFRDRCISEVKEKLREWEITGEDADKIIDELVESNFVNEMRFISSFVRGKFVGSKWGKVKIRTALKEKSLPLKLVEAALAKIDEEEYLKTARNIMDKKWAELSGMDERTRKSKVYYHMMSRGFEAEITMDLLRELP